MSRPLSFLHLTTFYPPYSFGGDAMYLYRLCHALGDLGHHVEVVHCVDSYHLLHPEPPPAPFAEHPNVLRHELRSPFGALSPLLSQQTGRPLLKRRRIQRILREGRFDVVHFHNASLLGPGVLSLQASPGAVKMYTAHEHWLVCPTHVLYKFGERPCEKPECLKCTLKARRPPQLWRYTGLLDSAARHIDQFLAPSRFTARMHAERGFSRPLKPLPYFLERQDQDWQSPGPRPQEAPYFLFVGRLERIKGLHELIRVWKDVPYDLLVAGAGGCEVELRALAAANPRIKFLGYQRQCDLGRLYHHAVACIVPSVTYETFGIIIIEAFARKTPVIVRNLGALPEVVEDSQGGFIFNTEGELLNAIHLLGASKTVRDQLGNNGYTSFLKLWCRQAHIELYFSALESAALTKYGFIPWENQEPMVGRQLQFERRTYPPGG